MSNKPSGDMDATGAGTKLGEPLPSGQLEAGHVEMRLQVPREEEMSTKVRRARLCPQSC